MKYVVFVAASAALVPALAVIAARGPKYRGWLLGLLVFSTVLGDVSGVNFVSMEAYRGPDRGFEVTLTDLLAWSLGASLLMRHGRRIRWMPPGTVSLAILFLVGLAGTIVAPEPLYATFTLWKWTRLFVVYLVVANTLSLEFPLQWMRIGLTGIAAVITLIAVKQKYVDHLYRIPGPFDHSNTIPLYLNLFLPVLVVWALSDRTVRRPEAMAMLAGALGMLFAVVATYSRAGMALAALTMVGAIAIANLKGRTRRASVASAVLAVLVLGGAAKAGGSIMHRIETAPKASEEARSEFNAAADRMAADHLLGVGLNSFSHVLTRDGRYNRFIGVMKDEAEAGVCHHIYRLTAAELGYGGLLAFVAVLLRFLWIAVRWSWTSRALEATLLGAQVLGFTALHLSGFLEWAFRITPVSQMFVIQCGLAVALAARVQAQARARRRVTP
jgi:hypothetical protein